MRVEKEIVLKALENYFGSEYLYALRCANSQLLYLKASEMLEEADMWYAQARDAGEWGYCGEKLLEIVKEYGEKRC